MQLLQWLRCDRFFLDASACAWSALYQKDPSGIEICGNILWRSADGTYLIFHNGSMWIVTHSNYEKELTKESGGYAWTSMEEPWDGGWNIPCTIRRC